MKVYTVIAAMMKVIAKNKNGVLHFIMFYFVLYGTIGVFVVSSIGSDRSVS